MKKAIYFLTALLICQVSAFTVRLRTIPASPVANEMFQLVLETDTPETPRYTLPQVKGLQISGNISSRRSSISIVNGKQEQSFSYGINAIAASPGKYTIPPFELSAGGTAVMSAPLTFTVREDSLQASPDGKNPGRAQMQMRITPERQLYVGETAMLTLEVLIPDSLRLNSIVALKESGFGDALFIPQGRNKTKFVQMSTRQRVFNNVRYTIYELGGYFQPQSSGEFTPVCEALLQVAAPGRDDFFGSGFFSFGSTREVAIRAAGKPLSVRPLPPVPAGAADTGLVGNWLFDLSVPLQAEFKSGEVAEITLNVSGDMPAELFRAPEITIPQARVYPPEVKRTASGFTVKYLFVPLTPGAQEVKQLLAFFVPEKGRYEVARCAVKFLVVPGTTAVIPAAARPADPAVNQATESVPAAQIREFPLYPMEAGYGVPLPFWENQRTLIIFFLFAGAVMMLTALVLACRKKDPSGKEQKKLRREIARIAAEISASGSAQTVLHDHGLAQIASALGLPQGATAAEIADKVDDGEIKAFFLSLNDAAFLPGKELQETPALRKKLTAFLKKLTLIILLLTAMPLMADFQSGRAAFDAGKYAEAKEIFRETLDPNSPSPVGYFNFGCPSYMLGEYPTATLAFERALLLAPNDSRIRSAFHNSLAKLPGAKPDDDGSFSGFAASLRDRVRPDQYMLIGSFCFFVLGIFSLCGKFTGKRALVVFMLAIIVICAAALWSQIRTTYSPDRARITAARAEMHRLPAASGSVAGIIPGGSEVTVVSRNGSWVQIRLANGSGGWVKDGEVEEILPYGIW